MATVTITNTLTKLIATDDTVTPAVISPTGITTPCTPTQEYIDDMVTLTDGTLCVPAYDKVQTLYVPFEDAIEFEVTDYKEINYYQNLKVNGADIVVELD